MSETITSQPKNDKITITLILAIFSSVLGMFQFGFNTGVINAPQKVLEEFIKKIYNERNNAIITDNLKDFIWSTAVGIFAIGGMLGGYLGPKMADRFGRKLSLIYNLIFGFLGITFMSISHAMNSFETIIIGRLIIGFNCGANTALVPMYLSEIATSSIRGAVGFIAQFGATSGILISQILGFDKLLGTDDRWPYLFAFGFVPLLIQLIALPFCPESPRFLLLNRNQEVEARSALKKLRQGEQVDEEVTEMRDEARALELEIEKYGRISSVMELFKYSWLREPLIIAIVMQLSQQLSGINAVFYYSTDIFLSAKIPIEYAFYATLSVGIVLNLMTLVSIPLIDRLGRRVLHLTGLGGMFWMSLILVFTFLTKNNFDWVKYVSVVGVLLYVLFFSIGPGALPWMITSELFTQGARPAAVSVAVLVNWSANFLIGLSFPLTKRLLQDYLFLPYAILIALMWIFIYKKLPETKNRSFEEISAIFKKPNTDYGSNNEDRRESTDQMI